MRAERIIPMSGARSDRSCRASSGRPTSWPAARRLVRVSPA